MNGRPVKHSVTLRGHRTSISLEDAFWQEFRTIARAQNKAINALIAEIDATRDLNIGLASSLRLFVLDQVKLRSKEP